MAPQDDRTSATEQGHVDAEAQVQDAQQHQDMSKDQNTDISHKEGPISPEVNANILSLWTMWWINGLFRTGYRRQIQEDDLYQLLDQRKAHVLGGLLLSNWDAEKAHAKTKNRAPSLLRALVKSFWRRYLPGYICLEIGGTHLFKSSCSCAKTTKIDSFFLCAKNCWIDVGQTVSPMIMQLVGVEYAPCA